RAGVLRGMVRGLGAAAWPGFGWLEFLFAGFLLYTAAQIARRGGPPLAAEAGAGQSPAAGRPAPADGLPGTSDAPEPPQGIAARVAARLTRRRGSVPVLAPVAALRAVA